VYLINPKYIRLTCLVAIAYHQQKNAAVTNLTQTRRQQQQNAAKNESTAKQIEDICEAFDPRNEVLDKG
jgi:hypothetical protein